VVTAFIICCNVTQLSIFSTNLFMCCLRLLGTIGTQRRNLLMFVDPCIIVQFMKKNPTRWNNISIFFIISYLYEAQHVSDNTPPIIRSLKLHWQPLIFHTWKDVGRVVGGRCQAHCAWQRPPTTRTNNLPLMKNQRLPVQF